MTALLTPTQLLTPPNKFYPPHLNQQQLLFRPHLIENTLRHNGKPYRIIAIEAQAGQGKTTLAYQYLNHYSCDHVWYQIGKEDADPVILLSSLLHIFSRCVQGFTSPQLHDIINQGEIGPLDLPRCTNILLNDIARYLDSDLTIVFDDLHLIANAPLTNSLLTNLLDCSPPNLHFILTSRHPFELKSKAIRKRASVAYLNTEDLALSSVEIEQLFNEVFGKTITITDARKIENLTSGWVMGIVLAAHPMSGNNTIGKARSFDVAYLDRRSQREMLEYFQDEIFTHIPDELHIPFLKLSFVDEIHVNLASRITEVDDIDLILNELVQDNLFIYPLDSDFQSFRFHHLFQEFLQIRARKILDGTIITTIYRESASYFLEKQMIDKALLCYRQGNEYARMDELLKLHGVDLLAQNRTLTILTLLESIPHSTLFSFGWLTLYRGILASDFQPEHTYHYLCRARELFKDTGEQTGELMTLAQTMYYHFVVSGRYKTGAELLPRAERLLENKKDNLSQHSLVWILRNIAAGLCFFSSEMKKGRHYVEKARNIAIRNNIRNFMASTVFVKAYIELFSGNRQRFSEEVEISASLMNDPLVSNSNKLSLRIMQICNLSMNGDISNYFHQQQLIQEYIDDQVVKQTIAAPYCFIWGASCLISTGETSKAMELLHRGETISMTAKSEHMRSQLLQWQAYIHAIQGNATRAREMIEHAEQLRHIAGGPFYQSFHRIIAGSIYGRLGMKKYAKLAFSEALQLAEAIPSSYLIICYHMLRSYFFSTCYDEKSSLADLKSGLTLMINHNYDHFWGWEPHLMQRLLKIAIVNDIHRGFCQNLARRKLKVNISESGEIIPLMHVTLLDGFYINFGNEFRLSVEELTPLQRDMLSLILISKNKKIAQDRVQLHLWPDSSPAKSRKKLDTLLGRLRATFATHMAIKVKNYLSLNKGILSLNNSTSDIEEFLDSCETGFHHAAREENWQAGNCFKHGLSLWKGTMPSETFRNDAIYHHESVLLATFERAALTWTKIMADGGCHHEIIPILEKILAGMRLSENAIIRLCKAYNATSQPVKARQTLENYRKTLQSEGYPPDEIESLLLLITAKLEER